MRGPGFVTYLYLSVEFSIERDTLCPKVHKFNITEKLLTEMLSHYTILHQNQQKIIWHGSFHKVSHSSLTIQLGQ